MPIPRRPNPRRGADFFVAADDAAQLRIDAAPLVERALGVQWYEAFGNEADVAAYALCRLRRAQAGAGGGPAHGDAAVREALGLVTPEALAWIASRAISYMDENGYPEAVEPFVELPEDDTPDVERS